MSFRPVKPTSEAVIQSFMRGCDILANRNVSFFPAHNIYSNGDLFSQSVTHTPYNEQQRQYPTVQPPTEESEGERGLGGSLLGGVAGLVAGHQVHHGLLGAVGGGIAGSLLEHQLKKHNRHEHEDDYEHEDRHEHRHHHGHHHHHHHHHSHSRHRSVSRNRDERYDGY